MTKISDKEWYKYGGKCRQCGFYCEWVGLKKETTEYNRFYAVTHENLFPAFFSHCENCDNEAVFDLTAISKNE